MKHRPGKARSLPPLPSTMLAPPEIRLANQSVMRGEWVDVDDTRPSAARVARTIRGWRTYDPLRKVLSIPGSSITIEHVAAADRLRRLADGCAIGFSGGRELVPVQGIPAYLPRTGFGVAALRTAQAWPAYRRAMQLFCVAQRALIARVILANWSVRRWCTDCQERGLAVTPAIEMGRLLSILDVLVEHFKTEIERDIGRSAVV